MNGYCFLVGNSMEIPEDEKMDIMKILGSLDISILGLVWEKFRRGWSGVAVYLVTRLASRLSAVPPLELVKYTSLVWKTAQYLRFICQNFTPERYVKSSGVTCDLMETFARHLEDGKYTKEEADADLTSIVLTVKQWSSIARGQK